MTKREEIDILLRGNQLSIEIKDYDIPENVDFCDGNRHSSLRF